MQMLLAATFAGLWVFSFQAKLKVVLTLVRMSLLSTAREKRTEYCLSEINLAFNMYRYLDWSLNSFLKNNSWNVGWGST